MRRPRAAGHFSVTPRARRLASASALARRGRPVSRRERIGCWALTAERCEEDGAACGPIVIGALDAPGEPRLTLLSSGRGREISSRPFLLHWILGQTAAPGPTARNELAIEEANPANQEVEEEDDDRSVDEAVPE